jgi:multidrug efflux pump subunit AcrB
MEKIRRELPDEFPGCALYFQPADIVSQVLNFGLSAPIDVQIEGTEVEKSYALARDLANRIRLVPGASDVRIPQVLAHPALAVDVDRRLAAHIGVTERDVANNLLVSLSSSALVAPSFWINPRNNVNYAVVVQTPLTKVDSVASLLGTPLGRGAQLISSSSLPGDPVSGGASYLGAVARLRPDTDVSMINHVAVQRVIDVQASASGRDLGGVALGIQKAIDSLGQLPKATRIHIRGQSESMFAAFGRLGVGLVLAIVLVYLLLVVLFQSFLDPFIILVAVPGALIGILWMLALTGTTLNVESFMGAIMAVGIATSNSILLVSAANDARVHEKLGVLEAVIAAGRTRLRPVLMTALAMLLGMVPMALALGEGGEQNAPLGRAVIGGLLVATFVTLFVVPAVYTILRRAMPRAHQLDEKFEAESRMEPTRG